MLTKAKVIELFGYGEGDNFVEISPARLQELGLLDEVQTVLPDLCFPYYFRDLCFTMDFTPLSEDHLFRFFPGLAAERDIYVIGHLPHNSLHGFPLSLTRKFETIHWSDGGFPSNASLYELGNHVMHLSNGEIDFDVYEWNDLLNGDIDKVSQKEQDQAFLSEIAKSEILSASRVLIDLENGGQIIILDSDFWGIKNLRTFRFFNSSLRQLIESLIACRDFLAQDHEQGTWVDISPLETKLERIDPRCVDDENTVWLWIMNVIRDDIFGF